MDTKNCYSDPLGSTVWVSENFSLGRIGPQRISEWHPAVAGSGGNKTMWLESF